MRRRWRTRKRRRRTRERWRWARGSTWFGKGRARGEAKTLRRSIPSLRATRFRSPAAFMHQERGQEGRRRGTRRKMRRRWMRESERWQ